MKLRYVANACFLITLAGGRRLLTDPWFQGPFQQTWWNASPVPDRLVEEVCASRPDFLYISHLHPDHLHAESLVGFDRATPVIVGAMSTPDLCNALAALGFRNLIETPYETRTALGETGVDLVLFKDFHGRAADDATLVAYDLDTSLYLYDTDGTRLFLGVDNTLLPADAARIADEYGAPDVAQLPLVAPPCSMADADDANLAAMATLRACAAANFRELTRALRPERVVPAGGDYGLGGPAAPLSRLLAQSLASELAAELEQAGLGEALARLYPGDELDSDTLEVACDADARFRDFTATERAA